MGHSVQASDKRVSAPALDKRRSAQALDKRDSAQGLSHAITTGKVAARGFPGGMKPAVDCSKMPARHTIDFEERHLVGLLEAPRKRP